MHLLWLLCSSRPNEIFSSSREREIAAQLWAQLNGRAAHDLAHLAPVQCLGWVSGVKHRPSKPPLQAGYPEHGKTEFLWLLRRAHFRKDEFGDSVNGGEKKSDTIVFTKSYIFFLKCQWKTFSMHVSNTIPQRDIFSKWPTCKVNIIDVPWLRPFLVWPFICSNEITHETRMHVKKTQTLFSTAYFIARYVAF